MKENEKESARQNARICFIIQHLHHVTTQKGVSSRLLSHHLEIHFKIQEIKFFKHHRVFRLSTANTLKELMNLDDFIYVSFSGQQT